MTDLRTRKRLATRALISTAATRLFLDRGFDKVTVDDIAAAADVGRMTVFNHFPRKEDMFFDRDEEGRDAIRAALRERAPGVSPVEALRVLAHQLVADNSPYISFSPAGQGFMATIAASETLKARARAIRDEIALVVAEALGDPDDANARLAAGLLLATWTEALLHGHRVFAATQDTAAAQTAFLAVIDRGSLGVTAAMAETPYA